MSKDKIKERNFITKNALIKDIFGQDLERKIHVNTVFVDDDEPKVVISRFGLTKFKNINSKSFEKLMKTNMNFDESLLLSSLYHTIPNSLIKKILSKKIETTDKRLESLLKPTNGYIIYSYQFEQTLQLLLDVSFYESVEMRRLFNRGKSYLDKVNQDSSQLIVFQDVLEKHMVTDVVVYPNYSGAKNLMLYVSSNN